MLSKCPGIGKKTAERLVVELKSKVGSGPLGQPASGTTDSTSVQPAASAQRDAIAALLALGYKAADADAAVRQAALSLGAKATTEALIKKALA
jgi:Holliday junction DNA helicase RuvA